MKISELVNHLRTVMAQEGDLDVVSGLARSGYGEAVKHLKVTTCKAFEADDENPEAMSRSFSEIKVLDLMLSDASTVELF